MKPIDDAALDRLIERVTREVLVELQQDGAATGGSSGPGVSAHNFVAHVQPVLHAGADRIASTLGAAPTDGQLSGLIDHTLLKPDASQDEIARLCYEARKYHF